MKKASQQVRLVHNPTAGDAEHSKKQLLSIIKAHNFSLSYSSAKDKFLKAIDPDTELIAIAGGDGTIRKTVLKLLNKKLKFKRPVALLPLGTANNIAGSFGIDKDHHSYVKRWKDGNLKKLDVGHTLIDEQDYYFIESFGLGAFPALMKAMKAEDIIASKPEEEIKEALKRLAEVIETLKPFKCAIKHDQGEIEGDFLMVEVMNIARLGPQLVIAKDADPGDGLFNLILVKESERTKLLNYIISLIKGKKKVFPFNSKLNKKIAIQWDTKLVHVDDELLKLNKNNKCDLVLLKSLIHVVV